MATMKKTTASTEAVEAVKEDSIVAKDKVKAKVFSKSAPILCRSINNGGMGIEGAKSGNFYQWADYGDEDEVEYQDLIYMVRARQSWVYKPRLIILDEDFVEQNPQLKDLYDSLYTTKDLKDILKMTPAKMKAAIENLPDGAKDSIKGIVATMIDTGALDSISKVKVIDEIFGTKLLLTLAER